MRVVIIGGGVAGSIMARNLSRLAGMELHCLERVAQDDQTEAGTGLNVCPNAAKATHAVDPDLYDIITRASLPWTHWRVSLTNGQELFNLPMREVADYSGWRIRWSDLYTLLRHNAAPAITYRCTVTEIAPSASDPCKTRVVWQQDGKSYVLDDIDLLIGADGRYSQVRQAITGAPRVTQVGVSIFRLLVPDTSGGLIDDYEQWFHQDRRLLAFRIPSGHIYIAGTFPIDPSAEKPVVLTTEEEIRAVYLPADGAPGAQARWLVDTVCDHLAAMHWARVQQADICYADPHSDVLYVGDSAHGMVPTLGQGATQAFEDACTITALIRREWLAGRRDVRAWLEAITQLRTKRLRFVMDLSLAASDTILAGSDPVAGAAWKLQPAFLTELLRLYNDVPMPV